MKSCIKKNDKDKDPNKFPIYSKKAKPISVRNGIFSKKYKKPLEINPLLSSKFGIIYRLTSIPTSGDLNAANKQGSKSPTNEKKKSLCKDFLLRNSDIYINVADKKNAIKYITIILLKRNTNFLLHWLYF